uniref:Disease resistance R13L4/SHOC-2-like LRR domain-containing protein n=1 Tax=Triticum urartu TaxID=4572 RepID=A0A8R7JXL5_TRIUA
MLDLQGTRVKILLNEVFDLFNLRYLGLRYTDLEILQEIVGRLRNLEVLDAAHSKLTYLPNRVVELKKLRYLYAFPTSDHKLEVYVGSRRPLVYNAWQDCGLFSPLSRLQSFCMKLEL